MTDSSILKVALIARATLYSSPGGDTTQVLQTAEHLRQLGIQADVFTTDQQINYAGYGLLHFFNIIRPADILGHVARSQMPYVVSTIFLDYGGFEKEARSGLMGLLNALLSDDAIEYLKAIARFVKNGERIGSTRYLRLGHSASVKQVAAGAKLLLPNSENEYLRLEKKYGIPKNYRVIPNGINEAVAKVASPNDGPCNDAVLCVARIEGRKNQLNLIRALNNTDYRVIIHGKPSPNNKAYYAQCKEEAASNIQFSNWLSEMELYAMYAAARVHVLPSYFETTGLSSLEAAVMGCNVVVTDKGDVRDYFKNNAWYCEPSSPGSIKAAVDAAFNAPYDPAFRDYILQHYTWRRAAEETLKAYYEALA